MAPAANGARAFSTDPAHSAMLPASWYYDPAILAAEKEAIYFASWQFAGALHDLPEPGCFFTAAILDQSVIVLRDKKGRLRAYYNVCAHRGHEIVQGAGRKTILTCPYHAWSYDLDGSLKAAGNAENVAGFDFKEFGLKEIRVEAFANLAFVNFDPAAAPLAAIAGDLEADFRRVVPDFDALVPFRRDHYDIRSNWKIVIENFLECYHCPVVHPGVMGEENANMQPSWESEDCGYFSRHIIRAHTEEAQQQATEKLPFQFRSGGPIKDAHLWGLWPNVCFIARPGDSNFQVFHVMPSGPETTHETLVNFGKGGAPEALELASFDRFRDELNWQDIGVVESVQRAMHSRGFKGGRLMVDPDNTWRSEASVHHFDKMVWEAVNGRR
jgi:choline monooxygenase